MPIKLFQLNANQMYEEHCQIESHVINSHIKSIDNYHYYHQHCNAFLLTQ